MKGYLKYSRLTHPEESTSKEQDNSCSAAINDKGTLVIEFRVKRKSFEKLAIEIDPRDLKELMMEAAVQMPGAVRLFTECAALAARSDNEKVEQNEKIKKQLIGKLRQVADLNDFEKTLTPIVSAVHETEPRSAKVNGLLQEWIWRLFSSPIVDATHQSKRQEP